MSKKTRGPNFTSNEKEMLIHLITKYKDVVENKKTDAVTTATKNEGWKQLTEEFNSLNSFSVRNIEQLKTCWDNIKRNTRKDKARTKKELIITGGGRPNLPPPGPFQDQVEVLLGPTLSGMENPFDSDAQYTERDDASILIEKKKELTENSDMMISGISTKKDDLNIVLEYEPTARPSTISKSDDISKHEIAGPSKMSIDDDGLMIVPEDKNRYNWNGWSPAALKTKLSGSLKVQKQKDSSSWLRRRRPKASLQDKLLESKLELVELMKNNSETEAQIKRGILQEQLQQEKIKTEILILELQRGKEITHNT